MRRLRPDVVFGADLIAGFPTETEAMFENSLAIVDECGLTHLHVFPFSPRPGTPAARMPQLDRALVKERAARLRAEGRSGACRGTSPPSSGATRRVLVERGGLGRTEHFTLAEIDGGAPGEIVAARIAGHTARALSSAGGGLMAEGRGIFRRVLGGKGEAPVADEAAAASPPRRRAAPGSSG